MRDCTLSNKKIAELERFYRLLHDKRQANRVKAVLALLNTAIWVQNQNRTTIKCANWNGILTRIFSLIQNQLSLIFTSATECGTRLTSLNN